MSVDARQRVPPVSRGESRARGGPSLRISGTKKYRPPRPKDMKGGCSPQNAPSFTPSVESCNKNFQKIWLQPPQSSEKPASTAQVPLARWQPWP